MGVKHLWKIISPCGKKSPLKNKVLAIDTSIWLYQYKNLPTETLIFAISKRIFKILYNEIWPIFIFDGKAPSIKKKTIENRRKDRLKSLMSSIIRNKECKICHMPYKKCIHINDPDQETLEKLYQESKLKMKNHDFNWGYKDDSETDSDKGEFESSLNLQENKIKIRESISNSYNFLITEASYGKSERPQKCSEIESFDPESIQNLNKKKQLKKLLDLRSKRKQSMVKNNVDSTGFSMDQINNVKKRNLITSLIKSLNDKEKQRIKSDCTLYSYFKKDPENKRVHKNLQKSITEVKEDITSESTSLEELLNEVNKADGWSCVYESYNKNTHKNSTDKSILKSVINNNKSIYESADVKLRAQNSNIADCSNQIGENIKFKDEEMDIDKSKDSDFKEEYISQSDETNYEFADIFSDTSNDAMDNTLINSKINELSQKLEMYDNTNWYGEETKKVEETIKTLLNIFGLPFIESPGESDSQIWYLFKNKLIDGAITEDSDMIIYGTTIYKNFFRKDKDILMFELKDVENKLGLDQQNLIKLSFILGSDYCPGIKGLGIKKSLEALHNIDDNEVVFLKNIYTSSVADTTNKIRFGSLNRNALMKFLIKHRLDNDKISELLEYCRILDKTRSND